MSDLYDPLDEDADEAAELDDQDPDACLGLAPDHDPNAVVKPGVVADDNAVDE